MCSPLETSTYQRGLHVSYEDYKRTYGQDYGQTYGQSYGQSYGQYGSYNRYDDDDGDTNWTYVVTGTLFIAAGAYLIYKGLSSDDEDHTYTYDTRSEKQSRGKGVQVRESIVVNKPVSELYAYWRKLENLPRIMSHLESVTEMGTRSHWKAKGPLGMSPEWDATITDERKDETISWRSLEGSEVPNEGTVRFIKRGDSSTEILVSLTYHPPLGPVGAAVAKLFGEEPSQQIRDDLQNFKQSVESGSLSLV
ncbi:cyclase/dehydrase [Truepera radiovictrix DSM 17093]|uniref:Cyclase/dehydrase n=1 Tax=Truepera radiovictrix (strain DSM 17093 / CIP 108686 / LMG 22925 / RQ-24) TaxID=649638 RepID=D7CXF6_TRURR|nr:cyclase/dehydrase [Truepera radiovictrix DSM 17093]